ncbi:aladin [Trichogramma pretiosum]|uniref:aladin n=1 Tax=Trichogramma pretiosum TaxID=7493 RepID=UPI0006C997A1|nr:aladin [Trichogramma pretiosum]
MLKVPSLADFDSPELDDCITASYSEKGPIYCSREDLQAQRHAFFRILQDFPSVNITLDMLATRESACSIGARDLFLPVQDSPFKKIISIWREKGIVEAIRTAADENPQDVSWPIHWLATKIVHTIDMIEAGSFWSSVLPTSGSGSVADVAANSDWTNALIRCIAWHPHCIRLAIATRDDRIRILSTSNIGTSAVLRHSSQKSVCCMSWRPHAGRELAAACQNGVLIWNIELGAASNTLSQAFMLKYRNHAPVTSVSWSPQGDLLVSCSLTDMNMIIWDVSMESGVPLRRVGGGGLCFTRWSSCGSRLLATTCRKIFRVWNTGTGDAWTAERWTVPGGRVAAACFGPNLTLLFTSTEDPATVFSLPLQEQVFDSKVVSSDTKAAVPLIDLSKVSFASENEGEEISVGGRVVAMDWDPKGKYLAIMFQNSPMIAIFKTKIGSVSRITSVSPLCLVKGFLGEVPNCIEFYHDYQQKSNYTVLTIAWSSGFIQHFPILESHQEPQTELSKSLAANTLSNTFTVVDDLQKSVYTSFIG